MKARLSGMSPGGFFSAGTGACSPVGVAAGVPTVAAALVGCAAAGVLGPDPEVVPVEVQPASATVVASRLSRLIPLISATLDRWPPAAGQRKVKRAFALAGLEFEL